MGDPFKKSRWQSFNVTIRIIGGFFVLDGLVLVVWGLSLVLSPDSPIYVNGVPTTSLVLKLLVLAAGLILTILGLRLLFARLVQPDAGGSIWSNLGDLFRSKNR